MALTAIQADGWRGTYGSPPTFAPDVSPEYVALTRQGYDATATAVTNISESLVITQRVRQAYPNQASLTASDVALSDYVYSTDTTPGGVTNNSTETSPKPVANWITPDRGVVGNSIGGTTFPIEVLPFHRNARNGEQVAAVKFVLTDGTTTINVVVSASTVSGRAGDRTSVPCFRLPATDITSLNAGLITVNAIVYPWIGTAGSLLDSTASSVRREFSPRYFLKSTAKAASPPLAYLSTTGNDSTGVWSTDATTASATPFLTLSGALTRCTNGTHTAATGDVVDGCEVRLKAGTFTLNAPATTRTQNIAALTVARDPTVARATCVAQLSAAFRPRFGGALTSPLTTGALRFKDVTLQRSGAFTIVGEAGAQLEIILDDIDFDNANQSATYLSNSHDYLYGVTCSNVNTQHPFNTGTYEHRIFRGVQGTFNRTTSFEGWLAVGNDWTGPGAFSRGTRTESGVIRAYNKFSNPIASGAFMNIAPTSGDPDVVGAVIWGNVFEWTSATTGNVMAVSHDGASASTTHIVIGQNSGAGFYSNGRYNIFYDEGVGARTHKLQMVKGELAVQFNTKGDIFKTDGTRTGAWAFMYGVGCAYNFTQFIDANNGGGGLGASHGSFAQAYGGLGSKIGTSSTARQDPLFTNYQGTASGPTAGAGGGTYTLTSGSPAFNMIPSGKAMGKFDLAGVARRNDGTGAAGAYERTDAGPVVGSTTLALANVATLTGVAGAVGATTVAFGLSAIIGGAPPLQGYVALAMSASGTLSATGNMQGTTSVAFTNSGTLASSYTPPVAASVVWTIHVPTASTLAIVQE